MEKIPTAFPIGQLIRRVASLFYTHTKMRHLIGALSMLLCARTLFVLLPFVYKAIVDDPSCSLFWVTVYGCMRIAAYLFHESRDFFMIHVEQRTARGLIRSLMTHLLHLDFTFHSNKKTGYLTDTIQKAFTSIEVFSRFLLFNMTPVLLESLAVSVLFLYWYPWPFVFAWVCTVCLFVIFTMRHVKKQRPHLNAYNASEKQVMHKLLESLSGYITLHLFGITNAQKDRLDDVVRVQQKCHRRVRQSIAFLNIGQALILSTGLGLTLYMAVHYMDKGLLSMGDFVLFGAYFVQLYNNLHIFGFVYKEISYATVNIRDIFSLLDRSSLIKAPLSSPYVLRKGVLEFDKVCFSHGDRQVLENCSFQLHEGEHTALVGYTGAGKSTILQLIMRFVNVDSGRILVDGVPIQDIPLERLRSFISVVPQDVGIFHDTIWNNISCYENITKDDMQEVITNACLTDLVQRAPEGLHTIVGERGNKLSGGERQRIGLARVMLRKSPIIIFDEATSALDMETERIIQDNIHKMAKKRTLLSITHRLASVQNADRILVLEEGCISHDGSHHELLEQSSFYQSLWV